MQRIWRHVLFLALFLIGYGVPGRSSGASVHEYPRLANYYLVWNLNDSQVEQLAKWDVVIVDMENQITNPDKLKKLRQLNPSIKILAYITSQEIRNDALTGTSVLRKQLAGGIDPSWYLYDLKGNKFTFWPGTSMLNMTPQCPSVGGSTWGEYLAQFVARNILSSGLWDGVFYDNTWQDVTWFTKDQADSNRDGQPDINLDDQWRAGYNFLFSETRRLIGPAYVVVGNMGPGHKQYRDQLNGAMLEKFPQFGWNYSMGNYDYQSHGSGQRLMIINGDAENQADYRQMRFTLASTLLEDGYFSFDSFNNGHNDLWWYDEYSINLGQSTSGAISVAGKAPFDETSVWKREFSNGIALVNPAARSEQVDLGGDFEKISGRTDRSVNNGVITDQVTLSAQDGLIMLKTFQTLSNAVFVNGSFARFFDRQGYRARNGTFVSDTSTPGGAKVFIGDLGGEGQQEKVVVNGSKLELFNSAGRSFFVDYPFGINYHDGIELAVGHLFPGRPSTIVVSKRVGGEVVVYNNFGQRLKDFYPFGTRYQGGFSLAITPDSGKDSGQLIMGTGPGRPGEVLVYDSTLDKAVRRFFAYEKNYTGGLSVAVGDVDGKNGPEIITYPLVDNKPFIRLFTLQGKRLAEVRTRGILGSFAATLTSADVNHDGLAEIVLLGKQ